MEKIKLHGVFNIHATKKKLNGENKFKKIIKSEIFHGPNGPNNLFHFCMYSSDTHHQILTVSSRVLIGRVKGLVCYPQSLGCRT